MSLLDTFTGGKSDEAGDAMKRAEALFGNLKTPSKEELLLPKLQEYVNAGLMTPAQAQAYLQESNAFSDQNIDQAGTGAQVQALNQLSQVADAGADGTPIEQAQVDQAEQAMNRSVGGQRGAIEQSMAARGTPTSLIQAALENQTVGQDAQQAHNDALQAQAQAYREAVDAMSKGATVGQNLQTQQNTQANTVADAANAMQKFNAANRTNVSEANANRNQEATAYNTQNKQQISNNNTGNANARTQYNAGVPQTVYQDELAKVSGQAGAAQNYGDLMQKQGQQNAGITAGLINTATAFIPKPHAAAPPTTTTASNGFARGGVIPCMDDGGMVPGDPRVPGDSEQNDTVHVRVSPGEAIIPRTKTQEHMPEILSMLSGGDDNSGDDVADVATLLKAMRSIRMGVA